MSVLASFAISSLGIGAGVSAAAGEELPDGRSYELVTPPDKNGALISETAIHIAPTEVSEDGARVIAPSIQCFAGAEACEAHRGAVEGVPYEFTRTPSGWVTHPLAPPAGTLEVSQWWTVNANTGAALYSALNPVSGREDFYARRPGGELAEIGPLAESSVPTPFEFIPSNPPGLIATKALSHVVYQRIKEPHFWSFDASKGPGLYEYAKICGSQVECEAATPLLVGVTGGKGSTSLVSTCASFLGRANGSARNVDGSLSADGRIVYFTAGGHDGPECPEEVGVTAPPVNELYARIDGELPNAHSLLISGPASFGCETTLCIENSTNSAQFRNAEFEGAATDGSRVVFKSAQQLTNGATEGSQNLYESVCEGCEDISASESGAKRRLDDVSEGGGVGGPQVQGVVAVSSDGSRVYFVAEGALTGEEENGNHEKAVDGADNLYVYGEGHATFIAALSPTDEVVQALTKLQIANVTPDGRFLVFTSSRALTADDTRVEGEEAAQVFEYDALTRALVRVSVGQAGFNSDGNAGTGNASIVRGFHYEFGSVPVRSDPTMSDDGAFVFFMSPVGLTAQAMDDVVSGHLVNKRTGEVEKTQYAQNVYEYHDGEVSLISDGKDTTARGTTEEEQGVESPVNLLGVGVSGEDVFFSTFDPLVATDTDTQLDYYDAHVCSESDPCIEPTLAAASCGEGSCQGPVQPALSFGGPSGSATLSGTGNLAAPGPVAPVKAKPRPLTRAQKLARALRACHAKRSRHKRLVCQAQARKRYGPLSHAKKAVHAGKLNLRGGK